MAEALDAGPRLVLARGHRSCAAAGRCTARRTAAKPQWLLIKRRDEEADAARPVRDQPESVKTGRDAVSAGADDAPGAMKAVLTDERFSDPDWIFERKLDGIRCIAIRDGGPVRLLSRNDLSLNGRYPEIATALEAQARERFAVDGEVVAFEHGRQLPAPRRRARACFYYVFDVLWLDGEDVRGRPLRERKALLRDALALRGPDAADELPQRGGRGDVRGGLPQGLGGRDRQARRQPVHRPSARATG